MSSDWRDEDDGDGPQDQSYECHSAGHAGADRDFDDKAEDRWTADNKSPPRHCHTCRGWFKAQEAIGPIAITCADCGFEFIVSAERRISYHKGTGPWVSPRYCDGCEHDPGRRSRNRRDEAKKKYQELRREGQSAPQQPDDTGLDPPDGIEIPTKLEHYLTTFIYTRGHRITTMEHIKRHPEFADMSDEHILKLMLHLAMSTSSSVRQVAGQKKRITKGDHSTGYILIVDTSKKPAPFINFFKRKKPGTTFRYLKDQTS